MPKMPKKIQIRKRIGDTILSHLFAKNHYKTWLVVATVVGLLLRLQFLARDFWHDEAFQVLFSQMPISFILDSNDVHPPLFTLITKAMVWFTTEPLFLRLTILIISFMFALQFYLTIKEIFGKPTATFAYLFLMISPTFALYSTEFRSYSFVLLLTVIQMRYFYRMVKTQSDNVWLAYIILSCLMMYSHYMAGLIVATQFLYLILTRRFMKYTVELVIIVIWCAPLVYYINQTIPKIQSFWFENINLVSLISTFFYIITPPELLMSFNLFVVLIYLTIILGIIAFYKQLKKENTILWLLYLIVPIWSMWIFSQFVPTYHHRYFLFGGIAVFVLAGWVFAKFGSEYEGEFYKVPLAIILFIAIITPISFETPLKDSAELMTEDIPIIHLSTFSMSPHRVLLPDKQHFLATELTREQTFTSGGGVLEDKHFLHSEGTGFAMPDHFYLVTHESRITHGGVTIYAKDGLVVKKY